MFTMLGTPRGHIQYSGSNFSLGAATRFSDSAFMQYIQTSWEHLSQGSSSLSSGGVMDAT